MTLLLLFLLSLDNTTTLKAKQTFADPADTSDEFLGFPYDMDFSAEGRLYVVDRENSRVLVWNPDGTFKKGFGTVGEGPGEMNAPWTLKVHNSKVHVYDSSNKMSIFDLDGKYLRSFKLAGDIRTFAPISDEHFIFCQERMITPSDVRIVFILADKEGKTIRDLKEYKHHMLQGRVEGNNNTTIRPFAGQEILVEDEKGQWYMGYGAESKIYAISGDGKITATHELGLKTAPPRDDQMEIFHAMSFPVGNGQRMSMKDLPNVKIKEGLDMGFFTQLVVSNGKVLAAMTPLGGTNGVGLGFSKGFFQVSSLTGNKVTGRGSFSYEEDSVVLMNSGRLVAFVINEDSEYQIQIMDW